MGGFVMNTWQRAWLTAVTALTACCCAVAVRADIDDAPPAPTISFSVQPRFNVVPGTMVYTWNNESAGYDMFRIGNSYYLTSNGWWYRSGDISGPFNAVEETTIPQQVLVAYDRYDHDRDMNRTYDYNQNSQDQSGTYRNDNRFDDRYDRSMSNAPTAPRITIGSDARFYTVPGSSALIWSNTSFGYPVYRYNGSYYVATNGWWYRSDDTRGGFYAIRNESVPQQVTLAMSHSSNDGYTQPNRTYDHNYSYNYSTTPPVLVFTEAARFVKVPGTNVEWCANQRAYDLYRYHGDYYVSSNGAWFRSDHLTGRYRTVRGSKVPSPVFVAVDYRVRNGSDWAYSRHWHKHGSY